MKLTTSKTKQFCAKKEPILRDVLHLTTPKTKQTYETSFKNGKLSAELTASYQCVLRFFAFRLSKVLRLPRKNEARSCEVLRLSRKIILAHLKIRFRCSKMQDFSGNQRPDLLTCLMIMSLVLPLPRKCIFADPLQMSHACHRF